MPKNFEELLESLKNRPERRRMVVAAANDAHTLEAVFRAERDGIITPILVGDKNTIRSVAKELSHTVTREAIYDCADDQAASELAVQLIREGKADFLMKGKTDTKVVLKAVVNKEYGLGLGRTMSHFTILQLPGYHKLIAVVDGGMVPYPTLEQKKDIICNTVQTMRALGCECPKVGVLACVEKVNPKMPETVEARELREMNRRGEITDCIVEGPISYDCAMSREIADFKGFESPVAGDPDILVAPNIHAGNIMGKIFTVSCGAKMAGFVVGASCPIVVTSRGSSTEEKYLSIAVSAAAG